MSEEEKNTVQKETKEENKEENKVEEKVNEKVEETPAPKEVKKEENTPTPAKEKSSGGNRTCITCFGLGCIGLVVVAIIIAIASFFLFRQALEIGSDFESTASEQGFEEFVNNTGIELNDVSYEDMCFTCDPLVYEGEVEKIITISEDDASSWIQVVNVGVVALSDTQMNFSDDQVELKTNAGYAGATYPVYLSGNIERVGNKEVDIQVETVKVGGFSVPEEYVTYAEDLLNQISNDKIKEVEGLNIYKLEFSEGEVVFEGTVPESISY